MTIFLIERITGPSFLFEFLLSFGGWSLRGGVTPLVRDWKIVGYSFCSSSLRMNLMMYPRDGCRCRTFKTRHFESTNRGPLNSKGHYKVTTLSGRSTTSIRANILHCYTLESCDTNTKFRAPLPSFSLKCTRTLKETVLCA